MIALLLFFSLGAELPKFKPREQIDTGLLTWFTSLDDLRLTGFQTLFNTPKNLSLGSLFQALILGSETIPYLPATMQELVNEVTRDNKTLPEYNISETPEYLESMLQKEFFDYWWLYGLLYMGDQTKGYMSYEQYKNLFETVNSLFLTLVPILAIFVLSFLFFFFQLAFCFCCCKPSKSQKRGTCCQQVCHGILQVIFIFTFIFFAIGTSKLAIFRQDIYKLTDYLPEITIPIMESIENAVLQVKEELSATTKASYDGAVALNQTLQDYYIPIDDKINYVVSMNETTNLEVDKINALWADIKQKSEVLVSKEYYGQFLEKLASSRDMASENKETIVSAIEQLIGLFDTIYNLGFADKLDFGVHTLQYYIEMSKTDNYTSSNVLDKVLTWDNIGALSFFFSDYIFLQIIVIFFAFIMLLMMAMFATTIYTNSRVARCCASSSSLTPCFLSIVLFAIGAVATLLGVITHLWPNSMNNDINLIVNGALVRLGLDKLPIPEINTTEISKGFINFNVKLPPFIVNEIKLSDSEKIWGMADNESLYDALKLDQNSNINKGLSNSWNSSMASSVSEMSIQTTVFYDISENIKALKGTWTKEGYYTFTAITREQLEQFRDEETNKTKKALYDEILDLMESEVAVNVSKAVILLNETDMSEEFRTKTNQLFDTMIATVSTIPDTLRIILDNFQIKPIKGLVNTAYNEIGYVLTEALAYISIAAHIYIPASVIMVFLLLNRRKSLQPAFVSSHMKMTLQKRQRRSHNDQENEEDIEFNYSFRSSLQYRTSLLESGSYMAMYAGRAESDSDSDSIELDVSD